MSDALHVVDIGVNLADSSFASDRAEVLARAQHAGVTRLVVTGTTVERSLEAADLAEQHPGTLWSTAGVHPHNATDFDFDVDHGTLPSLRQLAALPQVVAIGECGLDYNRSFSPPDAQRRCFEAQVELACELRMPLFLHERDAAEDQLAILERHRSRIGKAVVHCFTGDAETLRRYLQLDLHIGITGWICDERRGLSLRELVREIPLDRLMLESDAPYLIPRTIRPRPRSRRNEPAHLVHVRKTVAESLDRTESEIAAATTATAIAFFGLA
jgi:TatD DNase family protein